MAWEKWDKNPVWSIKFQRVNHLAAFSRADPLRTVYDDAALKW